MQRIPFYRVFVCRICHHPTRCYSRIQGITQILIQAWLINLCLKVQYFNLNSCIDQHTRINELYLQPQAVRSHSVTINNHRTPISPLQSLSLFHTLTFDMAVVPQRTLNWLYSILIRVFICVHFLYSDTADPAGPLRPQADISRSQPDLLRRRQCASPISLPFPTNRCLQ